MAHRRNPWLDGIEAWLHRYRHGTPASERAPLMADYRRAVREIPEAEHREPAYWVKLTASFPATHAAATSYALNWWLFPPRDANQCRAAYNALLNAVGALRGSEGRTSSAGPHPWSGCSISSAIAAFSARTVLPHGG